MNKRNVRDELAEWKKAEQPQLHNKQNAKVTPAIVANVLSMVKQKRPFAEIARVMDLNPSTVMAIRRRHNA